MRRLLWLSALLLLVLAVPAAADERSLYSGPGPRPGPDALYAPLAQAPQLENTGPWQAPPLLVSGASAYRSGEFVYQGFLYDDHGARGTRAPNDPRAGNDSFSQPSGTYSYPTAAKYAGNAADLVELRVRPAAGATLLRLTYNTMIDPEVVGTTIALGSSPVALPFPHGAGVSAPAELFLTVHGSTAELRAAATGIVRAPAPTASVDIARRQVEIRVPHAAWDPGRSRVRMAAGTGLWDPAAGVYITPETSASETRPGGRGLLPAPPAFFDVAFRFEQVDDAGGPAPFEEPLPSLSANAGTQSIADPRFWRDRAQAAALRGGDISPFFAEVDFGRMLDGASDDMADQPRGVPTVGVFNRILASHHEPAQGVDFTRSCGAAINCEGQFLGRLQPYSIYVPRKPQPAGGFGLTLLLHSLGANHNQFSGTNNQSQFGERGAGHIVITPGGRGPDGWYYGLAGADTFEVWADVAARYRLDPDRSAVSGYSMGGYGTYKFATRYPDLFAKGQPTVGPPTLGISTTGRDSTSEPSTSTFFMLPSLRHIPMLMWVGSTDQLVPISSTTAQAQGFDDLGYRYRFDAFTPSDHFMLAVNDQFARAAEFLGDSEVDRNPAHVTYVVNPKMDFPQVGTVGDHAYWLSGLRLRDGGGEAPRGLIDVRSEGFGVGVPPALPTQTGGGTHSGAFVQTYVSRSKAWGRTPKTPVRNRLNITASNVARVVVNAQRAKVRCNAELDVETDGPLEVVLAGCNRTATFGSARSCRAAIGFARVGARRAGRRRVRIEAAPIGDRRFAVDVFQQSRGRTVIGNRRVARFRGRRGSFTWRAERSRAKDGVFIVRFRMGLRSGRVDTRRLVLVRRNGRWSRVRDYYRRNSCGTLSSFKLERPVFGGRQNRALGIAFRVATSSRVGVVVKRRGKVVRRYRARVRRGRLTHRLRLASEGLKRGTHRVTIRVKPRNGRAPVRASLVAKRL